MSDDIVERLRSYEYAYEPPLKAVEHMDEAADEIERLRAENERLREALKFYATERNWMDGKTDRTPSGAVISMPDSVAKDFGEKARAALEEKK